MAATSTPTGTGNTYAPEYLCASGGTCTGASVTGAGPMPSIAGAPDANSCIGLSDATSCLDGLTSVSTSTPLVLNSGTYSVNGTLTVNRSLIGVDTGGGQPRIPNAQGGDSGSSCTGGTHCGTLSIYGGASNIWVYNLHIEQPNTGQEYAEVVSLGVVNGVTIKGNYLKGAGDSVGDGMNSMEGSTAGSQNVIVDGNTLDSPHRTAIALTNYDRTWAIMNNLIDCPLAPGEAATRSRNCYVSPVDFEPNPSDYSRYGSNPISQIEYGYNFTAAPGASVYTSGILELDCGTCVYSGDHVYAHHNYGTPWGVSFLDQSNPSWSTGSVFTSNVQGTTVPTP